jgi:hypothetical protein
MMAILLLSIIKYWTLNGERNMNKKNSKLVNSLIIVPCLLHSWIFLCFQFGDWRRELTDEVQLRIFAGALSIVISFILYYIILYYILLKYYKDTDKNFRLRCIVLMIIINISSFLVTYFH